MAESKRKHKETVIGRKEFVQCINTLLESAKRWQTLEDTIGLNIDSPINDIIYTMESTFLTLLGTGIGDSNNSKTDSRTSTWFFEKLYAEKDLVACLDKKCHRLRSAGQLYDFIQKWKESKSTTTGTGPVACHSPSDGQGFGGR